LGKLKGALKPLNKLKFDQIIKLGIISTGEFLLAKVKLNSLTEKRLFDGGASALLSLFSF
jgi:hypothetical protein